MDARRSTTPAVTLFPFLAVLVCAMGALIFLLLITTRRIRQQSIERALAVTQIESEPVVAIPAAAPGVEDDPFDEVPILPLLANDPPPPRTPRPLLVPRGLSPVTPDPYEERLAELRETWQQTVADLERRKAHLHETLAQLESSVAEDDQQANLQQIALQQAHRRLDDVEAGIAAARQNRESLVRRRSQLEQQIRESEARLQQVIQQHAQAAGQFEVLPFDGRTGTTRRPILIECTERGFNFVSDGVRLTPDDVNGFTPQQNPLLAGTEALLSYWKARDLNSRTSHSPTGPPYVLLIVRPGGTLAYYIARRLLEPLDEPFGYELVTDQRFVAPESDAQAKAALERAIDYLLSDRERLLARTRGGTLPVADSLRFSDGSGRFYLDEVERLRENSQTVHFGGREVERERAGSAFGPRIVEFPRGDNADRGQNQTRETGQSGSPSSPSHELYDADIASETHRSSSTGRNPPPRRRSFEADGPIGWTSSRDRQSDDSSGQPAEQGATSPIRHRSPGPQSPDQTGQSGPLSVSTSLDRQRPDRTINVEDPQWGIRERGSSIGLERDVTICVNATEVRVADEQPLPITTGISRDQLQRDLALTLDAHVRSWGRPPNSFFWLPAIRFEVAPGGHQYYQRLKELVDDWKLRSSTQFVLE